MVNLCRTGSDALQGYLAGLSAKLFETPARAVRWHLDVDPIEFD